jgi:hypothetical protein
MTPYALRGCVVSLLLFLLTFTALWLATAVSFLILRRDRNRFCSSTLATLLYLLQIGPFLIATVTVTGFVLPSFLRFEPLVANEPLHWPHVLLSLVAAAFISLGIYRAARAYASTRRLAGSWQRAAPAGVVQDGVRILKTAAGAPPLVVVGILRPKVLISASARHLLTPSELQRGIAHEAVHARHRDNLKKLFLRFSCPWGIRALEQEWLGALELSADERSVSSRRDAVELASALVKASRLAVPCAELSATLIPDPAASLQTRVQRLLAWEPKSSSALLAPLVQWALTACSVIALIIAYGPLLANFHSLTEWLMR